MTDIKNNIPENNKQENTKSGNEKSNIHIYVINLDKDTQRLEEMNRKLFPNNFTRISAIYGNITNFENETDVIKSSRYLTPKTVIATGLSHKKAVKTYLSETEEDPDDFALILEDDAIPISDNYMDDVQASIRNAPPDWEIIKLDYLPNISLGVYNKIPTTLLTAYIINREGAKKYVNSPVCYHADLDIWFKNIIIYNNPSIIFEQSWKRDNQSNNQINKWYNPFSRMSYLTNYKAIRVLDNEYTIADMLLLIFGILVVLIILLFFYRMDIFPNKILNKLYYIQIK